ncbi:MAG: ribonuclease P [Candidatus Diapherotrites archaeon]|nr:ribonuclease P [Candidatus Diapherotrites archaeon]
MRPSWVKKAAQEMIRKLLGLAEEGGPKSRRYASLARKRSKKYKAPLPPHAKKRICKKCGAFLVPGKNLRVRKPRRPKGVITYTCLECGHKMRHGTGEKLKKRGTQKA